MTQILILNPPRRSDGMSTLFNNATLSLVSYLRRNGVSARAEPLMGSYWIDRLDTLLLEHQPEVIAISCKWWDTLYGAVELARLIRKRVPYIKLVCGGQTATYFAQDIVAKTDFDAVIRGDGEKPLLEYVLGQSTCNLTTKNGLELPTTYVQQSGDDLRLYDDLTELADPTMLRAIGYDVPFIWTGKGCRLTCLYCAGSALGHKRLFGRKGYMYRPIEHIIHDLEVLAPWSENTFMLDFDPIANPEKRDYYFDLFNQLPKDRYHLSFYCWTLPDPEFVDLIASRFKSAFISVDAQAYSEEHRRRLSDKKMIKPFRPNEEFEQIIEQIASYPHMDAGIYGIIGLPGESQLDINAADQWIGSLFNRFGDGLGELAVTPLATEPGSLVHRNAGKYKMELVRETFEDYLEFTRLKYHGREGIHDQPYDANLPHPFGVLEQGQHPSRVYHDYQLINSRINKTFDERRQQTFSQALQLGEYSARLTLQNRGKHRHVWDQVVTASGIVREHAIRDLTIDARQAFVHAPEKSVLALTGTHDYTLNRLPGLQQAIARGELNLTIEANDGQFWGAFEEIGATIVRIPVPDRHATMHDQ